MAENVGQIVYRAGIDTSKMRKDALEAEGIAKKTGDGVGSGIEGGTSRASAALSKLASVAKVAAIAAGTTLAVGIGAAAKASWDQVGAVQQATVGLQAYEKNGSKVNDVLKNLISYARSDMGVLFNRRDLFESAQSLKIMGDNTDALVGHVQILSRSVGLGLSNWEDLNRIVGRIGSTGRLAGDDFDNLTKAGYKLDPSLRNTKITFDELFKVMNKGIPADALAGQANTIRGLGVRLQTAFRGIGDAVLGVDADTSKFVEGGLGDKLVKGISGASGALKSFKPFIADTTAGFLNMAGSLAKNLGPSISGIAGEIAQNLLPSIKRLLSSQFAQTIGTAFVGAAKAALTATQGLVSVVSALARFLSSGFGSAALGAASAIGVLALAYKANALAVSGVASATKAYAAAQVILNSAILSNPIVLATAAVVGLGVALYSLSRNTDMTNSATTRLNSARAAAKTAADTLKQSEDALRGALYTVEGASLAVEAAQRRHTEAVAQFGPKSLEARQANYDLKGAIDAKAKADKDAMVAQQNRDNSQVESNKKKEALKVAEQQVEAEVRKTTKAIDTQWNSLGNLNTSLKDLSGKNFSYSVTQTGGGSSAGMGVKKRASGGPVNANQPYFVGENANGSLNKTSELFVPRSSGNIVNSKDLQNALANEQGSSSAKTIQYAPNIYSQYDQQKALSDLGWMLR